MALLIKFLPWNLEDLSLSLRTLPPKTRCENDGRMPVIPVCSGKGIWGLLTSHSHLPSKWKVSRGLVSKRSRWHLRNDAWSCSLASAHICTHRENNNSHQLNVQMPLYPSVGKCFRRCGNDARGRLGWQGGTWTLNSLSRSVYVPQRQLHGIHTHTEGRGCRSLHSEC